MKKIISILLVICCAVLCVACGGCRRQQSQISPLVYPAYVYVCNGKYAKKYHRHIDCKGLGNCKGEIIKITKQEAERAGRTPCSFCY